MMYSMKGIPAAAEITALLFEISETRNDVSPSVVRLNIDAAIKNTDGDTVARMVQEGFSEIAVTTGGKVYEY